MRNQVNRVSLSPRSAQPLPDGLRYFRAPLHETSGVAAAWETELTSGTVDFAGTVAAPFAAVGCATLDGNSWLPLGTTVTGLHDVMSSANGEAVHQLLMARLYYTTNPAADNIILNYSAVGVQGLAWVLDTGGKLKLQFTPSGGSTTGRVNGAGSAKNAWITIGLHLDHETGNLTHYTSGTASLTQGYTTGEINSPTSNRTALFARLSLDGTAEDTTYGQAFGTAAGTLISDIMALRLPAGTTAADVAQIVAEYDAVKGRELPLISLNRIYGA